MAMVDESSRVGRFTREIKFHEEPAVVERLGALAQREATSSAALIRASIRRLLEAADKEVPS
jgi:hypothetical protein